MSGKVSDSFLLKHVTSDNNSHQKAPNSIRPVIKSLPFNVFNYTNPISSLASIIPAQHGNRHHCLFPSSPQFAFHFLHLCSLLLQSTASRMRRVGGTASGEYVIDRTNALVLTYRRGRETLSCLLLWQPAVSIH